MTILFLALLSLPGVAQALNSLTPDEKAWLDANRDRVELWYNTDFPPIEFAGEGGEFRGLGADVVAKVENRLGVRFRKVASADWNRHLEALASGECAIAPTIVRTEERERFASFTIPYATAPVVIITTRERKSEITLDDLVGMRVAVVSGYATEKYLRGKAAGRFRLVTMQSVVQGLRAVSFGEVDAFVENLAVAAHYIGKEGLPNLRVAGSTDYKFSWSIGVSRKYPLLFSSIQKALGDVAEEELEATRNHWIALKAPEGMRPETMRLLQVSALFALLLLLGLAGVSYYLKRRLGEKVESLRLAQAELREQAERLHLALEASSDGLWDWNYAEGTCYFSPRWFTMLGYQPGELPSDISTWENLLHPAERDRVVAAQAEALESASDYVHEYRMRDRSGQYRWIFARCKVVDRAPDGRPQRVVGVNTDITERKEAQERYRAIFNNAPIGIFRTTYDGLPLEANPALYRMLGYPQPESTSLPVREVGMEVYADPEARARLLAALKESPLGISTETQFKRSDGSMFPARIHASLLYDDDGIPQYLDGTVEDITERKTMERALTESEEKYRAIFNNSPIGIFRSTFGGVVLEVNAALARMHGFGSVEEMLAKVRDLAFDAYPHPDDRRKLLEALLASPRAVQMEFLLKRNNGQIFPAIINASLLMDADGKPQFIDGAIEDITERKQMEEQLLFRALHDPLTGLANRTLCLDRIAQALERASRRPETGLAVVFMDLDRFKLINDSLGHEAGDQLLREVATRLLASTRRMDTVCRYGGDEFVLVLEELRVREVLRTIQRIRQSLKPPISIEAHSIQIEASFGLAFPESCGVTSPEELLRNANIALHRAKQHGRNRVVSYKPNMHKDAIQVMSLEGDMRRGLAQGEFEMFYQPIFHLSTSRLAGFEALLRWRHPVRGTVAPVEFIPVAEESGFIFELGGFALGRACTDMARILAEPNASLELTMSVNLSPRQFARQGLTEQIDSALASSGLRPDALVLEITESSILKHPEASAHILNRLKSRGVGVAIDDFGTGYSSMSALKRLPLDRLKIDKSFVSRITQDANDLEIVRAIITLAHGLGLKTVAEGIETQEQRDTLLALGCELGQGYLCARPVPLAETAAVIERNVCSASA